MHHLKEIQFACFNKSADAQDTAFKFHFQLTADTVNLDHGQHVLLNVEEEPRLDLEPAQTLLLQTEELIALGQAVKLENATPKDVQVRLRYGRGSLFLVSACKQHLTRRVKIRF